MAMVTAAVLGGLPPIAGLQEQTISLSRKMNGGIFVFSSLGTVLKHTGNSRRYCSDYPSHQDSSALLYAVFPLPLLVLDSPILGGELQTPGHCPQIVQHVSLKNKTKYKPGKANNCAYALSLSLSR